MAMPCMAYVSGLVDLQQGRAGGGLCCSQQVYAALCKPKLDDLMQARGCPSKRVAPLTSGQLQGASLIHLRRTLDMFRSCSGGRA